MSPRWTQYLPAVVRQRLEGRTQLQKVLSNISWLSFDKILRMGVGLFVGVWVARYLGPDQFGTWNYAIAFAALFSVFSTLGLDGIVVREIVNGEISAGRVLGTAASLRVVSSLLMIGASTLLVAFIRPADGVVVGLVAITASGYLFLSFDVIDNWFQSQTQSKYAVYAKNTVFVVASAIKVGLILLHAPLIAFVWTVLGEIGFSALGLIVAYQMRGQSVSAWRADVATAKYLLRQSWPLLLSAVSITIYMKIDQVMLGNMIGDDIVGVYSAATKISEIWYFIPSAIAASVFPSILRTRLDNRELYSLRIQKLFDVMVGLSLVIALPLSLLSTPVVMVLFGSQYASAGPVLAVHVWAAVFVFMGVAQGVWDIAENLTKLGMLRTMAGAGINVVLNLLLIPRYQAMGAALATVVSYAFSAYVLNIVSPKTRPILAYQTKALLIYRHLPSRKGT